MENMNNRKLTIFHTKNDVLKTSTSQRLSDSHGLRKNRIASRNVFPGKGRTFGYHFSRKWKFGCSFRHPGKSERAHQIDILNIDLCFWHKKWCQGTLHEISRKKDEKWIEKRRFFTSKNLPKLCPVQWIHGFRHLWKSWEIDAGMVPKMNENSSKSRSVSGLGSFLLRF